MRNRFIARCYVCGQIVKKGEGHFERFAQFVNGNGVTRWRTRHVACHPKKEEKPE